MALWPTPAEQQAGAGYPLAEALAYIDGHYTSIYHFNSAQNRWEIYDSSGAACVWRGRVYNDDKCRGPLCDRR